MTTALITIAVVSFVGGCCFRSAWFHRVKLKQILIKLGKGLGYWYLGLMVTFLCVGLGKVCSEAPFIFVPASLIATFAIRSHWKGIKST